MEPLIELDYFRHIKYVDTLHCPCQLDLVQRDSSVSWNFRQLQSSAWMIAIYQTNRNNHPDFSTKTIPISKCILIKKLSIVLRFRKNCFSPMHFTFFAFLLFWQLFGIFFGNMDIFSNFEKSEMFLKTDFL